MAMYFQILQKQMVVVIHNTILDKQNSVPFSICMRKFQMYDETKAGVFI